jgi:hypothetical protein
VTIERDFAISGFGLYLVELVVINTLVDDDAIRQDVLPAKSQDFADTHRGKHHQDKQRTRRLLHQLERLTDREQRKQDGWLDGPLPRQRDPNRRVRLSPNATLGPSRGRRSRGLLKSRQGSAEARAKLRGQTVFRCGSFVGSWGRSTEMNGTAGETKTNAKAKTKPN